MTEILTESFCERCGTRYTFESTGRHRGSVTRLRVLSRSLRNLVMTDGLSVADAMAAARIDEERAASVEQLDAFHRTFNFCLGCRQYTCANCWNEPEGKCLTCAPDLSREVLPAAFLDLPAHGPTPAAPDYGQVPIEAWPTADLPGPAQALTAMVAAAEAARPDAEATAPPAEVAAIEPAAAPPAEVPAMEPGAAPVAPGVGPAPLETIQPAAVSATQPLAATHIEPLRPAITSPAAAAVETEPANLRPPTEDLTPGELAVVTGALIARSASASSVERAVQAPAEESGGAPAPATTSEPAAGVEPPAAARADHVAAGRAQTASLLHRFRPARLQRLAEDAPPAPGAGTAAPPVAPVVSAAAATPVAPVVSAAAATPVAPVISAAAATPVAQVAPPVDVVPQPTWRMVAPDTTDTIAPDTGRPPTATPPAAPGSLLRARPAPRPGGSPAAPWAARLASARPVAGGVWAESSRDVLGPTGTAAPTGVQACVSCGLPLSANARFCRRCGSRQS